MKLVRPYQACKMHTSHQVHENISVLLEYILLPIEMVTVLLEYINLLFIFLAKCLILDLMLCNCLLHQGFTHV